MEQTFSKYKQPTVIPRIFSSYTPGIQPSEPNSEALAPALPQHGPLRVDHRSPMLTADPATVHPSQQASNQNLHYRSPTPPPHQLNPTTDLTKSNEIKRVIADAQKHYSNGPMWGVAARPPITFDEGDDFSDALARGGEGIADMGGEKVDDHNGWVERRMGEAEGGRGEDGRSKDERGGEKKNRDTRYDWFRRGDIWNV